MLKKKTDGSSRKMFCVPFPWCTSQSTMKMRETPCRDRRYRVAMAMLFRRQKPIPVLLSAWCPGGRIAQNARRTLPVITASAPAIAPPAERKATV
jgi:hypothetical protein